MNIENLKEYTKSKNREIEITFDMLTIGEETYNIICNKVILPIKSISKCYLKDDIIDIKNEENEEMGSIFFMKGKSISSIVSDEEFIAYLGNFSDKLDNESENIFEYDILLLNEEYLKEYLENYYKTTLIWGEFSHNKKEIEPYRCSITEIKAQKNLYFPTDYHENNLLRNLNISHSFERFLKYYHHFELLFDYDLIEKIKQTTDHRESAKLLADYKKDEIERLKYIIKKRLNNKMDTSKLEILINEIICKNNDICIDLLFNYGKDSNPFKNKIEDYKKIITNNGFSEHYIAKMKFKQIKDKQGYEELLKDFISYFFYRVRCSIAHNKIGEYLFDNTEEEFVSKYVNPLIKEVIFELD